MRLKKYQVLTFSSCSVKYNLRFNPVVKTVRIWLTRSVISWHGAPLTPWPVWRHPTSVATLLIINFSQFFPSFSSCLLASRVNFGGSCHKIVIIRGDLKTTTKWCHLTTEPPVCPATWNFEWHQPEDTHENDVILHAS